MNFYQDRQKTISKNQRNLEMIDSLKLTNGVLKETGAEIVDQRLSEDRNNNIKV
jgi:hypothetical protein